MGILSHISIIGKEKSLYHKSQKKQFRVQLKEIKKRPVMDKGDCQMKCGKIKKIR